MNKHPKSTAMPHSRAWLAVLLAGAALTLAACDKSDNRTAGEKLDSAVAKTEQAADTAAAKTGEAVREAKAKVDASCHLVLVHVASFLREWVKYRGPI